VTAILAAAMGTRSGTVALIAVAAVAAVAVAAGILLLGGDEASSRESYQSAVVNARDRVDFAYARIARSQSPEELIERLDDASVVVGDTASDPYHLGYAAYRWLLDRIRPPLWLHGHTTIAAVKDWRDAYGPTTVANVTGSVVVELVPPGATS